MYKISTALLALLQIGQLQAALPLNDQKTLEVPIPKHGLTRLSVQDDVIQDIFVYPQSVQAVPLQESLQLHKSGHVFIALEGVSQPFYLTVMTQKGKVQDLKIMPGSHGSGPVILTSPQPEIDSQEATLKLKKRVEGALLAAVQGFPPPGFQKVTLSEDVETQQYGEIQRTCLGTYGQKSYRIDVYTLDNKGDREVFLTPSLFLGPADLAVVFDQASLSAGGQVRMALLRKGPPLVSPSQASISSLNPSKG